MAVSAAALCIASVLFVVLSLTACVGGRAEKTERTYPTIENIDIRAVADGRYEGYYKYYNLADAEVRVTVSGGRITSIDVLKHFHFPFLSGKKVAKRIVEQQTLNVDAVSGATGSSIVVKKAVETALLQGI